MFPALLAGAVCARLVHRVLASADSTSTALLVSLPRTSQGSATPDIKLYFLNAGSVSLSIKQQVSQLACDHFNK